MQERESWLWPLYLYVYLSLGLSSVNWASQECLFYLRSSLRSLDLLLFHFRRLFPSLSCSHRHFGLLFLFYLPNRGLAPRDIELTGIVLDHMRCRGCQQRQDEMVKHIPHCLNTPFSQQCLLTFPHYSHVYPWIVN